MPKGIYLPAAFQCLFRPATYIALPGGRGSAKSQSVAQYLLLRARSETALFLCAREVQNSIADSVYSVLEGQAKKLGIHKEFVFQLKDIVHRGSGSKFIFKGIARNVENIKSVEGAKYCWVEEAAKLSQNSIDTLLPTMRQNGAKVIFTYNPDEDTDPIHQMFVVNEPPPDSIVVHTTYRDNPFFPDKMRRDMEWMRRTNYEKYLWVYEGQTRKQSEAAIYQKYRVEEFESPEANKVQNGVRSKFYYGIDWGFGSDPCAGVRCFIRDGKLFIDREWYGYNYDYNEKFTRDISDRLPGIEKYTAYADNQRPEAIRYLNAHGFRVRPCTKKKGSIEDGITFVKSFEDIVIHPACTNTIAEIKSYKYKVRERDSNYDPIYYTDPEDKNNHIMDAIRYAFDNEIFGHNSIVVSDEFLRNLTSANHANKRGRL